MTHEGRCRRKRAGLAAVLCPALLLAASSSLLAGPIEEDLRAGTRTFESLSSFHPERPEGLDVPGKAAVHPAIEPYVRFLAGTKTGPVDYVLGLFDRADIVILCERFHTEATQYDFIFDLIRDPRFIDRVGRVFTEVGTSAYQAHIKDFLHAPNLSEDEIDRRLAGIYQNFSFQGVWEKSNYYDFLRNVRRLNRSLPEDRQVDVLPSDVPFSWEGMTAEKYRAFERDVLPRRDKIMADSIAAAFDKIQGSSDARKKALVIMNYRHAFNDFTFADGGKGDNTGRYLFERYPGRVANVLINTVVPLRGSTDQEVKIGLIQDGKWDAAFAAAGDPDAGFDMNGSPFGEDGFDLFPHRASGMKYRNVFTGFIFHLPLEKHRHESGTPGLLDERFALVLLERFRAMGANVDMSPEEARKMAERLATRTVRWGYEFDAPAKPLK